MYVVFNQRWRECRPGHRVELGDGVANLLIARKIVSPVTSPEAKGEVKPDVTKPGRRK